MAVSTVPTHKFLNAWPRVMMDDQWRFNGVQGTGVPRNYKADAFVQPERDEVARALADAIARVTDYLEYYPRPVYITGEEVSLQWGNPYQLQLLETRYKHLIEFGSRATTLIDDDVTVTYSSSLPGSSILDKATITVSTSITNAEEIQVFFRTADGAPAAADELYEIEPLTVSISGGVATITGHRSLFVKPSTIWDVPYVYDSGNLVEKNYADIQDASHFVTKVDVYRVYTDTTNAVQLTSDDWLDCGDCNSVSTTLTAAGGRIYDKRLGLFQVRTASCSNCPGYVERVRINYKAGLALVRGRVDTALEEAIIRYANTFFGQPAIDVTDAVQSKWMYDRNPEDANLLTPGDVKNPFGIQRGAIFAWRTINNPRYLIGKGGKVTARG